MLDGLKNLFSEKKSSEQPAGGTPAPRSAALVRAELGVARDSFGAVAAKLEAAIAEVSQAQGDYDRAMENYALAGESEPDRGELAASISKADALRRIRSELDRAIARLTSELGAAELEEAISAGRERLSPLIVAADALVSEYEQTIAAARKAEDKLFEVLFNERTGLKSFSGALEPEARKSRFRLRNRAMNAAAAARYAINADFETDGEVNLGAREAHSWFGQFANGAQKAVLEARRDAAAESIGMRRK